MIQCVRCGSGVDETKSSSCQICGAPVNAAPAAVAQPVGATAEQPVPPLPNYLAGASTPVPGPLGTPGGGQPPPMSGYAAVQAPHGTPRPVTSTMPRRVAGMSARRESAPDNSRRKAVLINLTVIALLLLGSAGGGWWYWMHRTNPKAQVQRYLHAVQWLDWGVVYDLSSSSPGGKTRHEFIEKMDAPYEGNGLLKIVARHSYEKFTFSVGEPAISGDEATTPVTLGGLAEAKQIQFRLRNFGGVWKVEPLADNPLDILMGDAGTPPSGLGAATTLPPSALGGLH